MSTTVKGGYYLNEKGKPVDAAGKPVDALSTLPEGVNAFVLDDAPKDAPVPGPATTFDSAGGWYTAFDADGNEVGKVQGKDAFFEKYPDLNPGGE